MNTGEISRKVPSTLEIESYLIQGAGNVSEKPGTASKKSSVIDTDSAANTIQSKNDKNSAGKSIDISL